MADKQKRAENRKRYYEKNKEKIIEHLYERRFCEACQREYALYQLSKHRKSKKHINNCSKMKMT